MKNLQNKTQYLGSLILATTASLLIGCSNAAAVSSNAAISPSSAEGKASSGYQMQVLKDCKVQSQRPLTAKEFSLYQQLQLAEQQMKQLEAPMKVMEAELQTHSKAMENISSQIEQQAWQRQGPDPKLLQAQAELSNKISAVVDNHQADIDALTAQGDHITAVADEFEQLILTGLVKGSFDQIRLHQQGTPEPDDCRHGMFFTAVH